MVVYNNILNVEHDKSNYQFFKAEYGIYWECHKQYPVPNYYYIFYSDL